MAGKWVAVHQQPTFRGSVTGGVLIVIPEIRTVEDWCAYYGAVVKDGVAILYKGVDDKYRSGYQFDYVPGTVPDAPDWDGGVRECGKGLHFCASPSQTLQFNSAATRFLACPVALTDMRAPRAEDGSPNKIKARGCCAPVFEVDRFGDPVPAKTDSMAVA